MAVGARWFVSLAGIGNAVLALPLAKACATRATNRRL